MQSRRRIICGILVFAALILLLALGWFRRRELRRGSDRARPDAGQAEAAKEISRNHWRVPRRDRERYLSDMDRLNREIRLQPTMGESANAVRELRIEHLSPGSPAQTAGFREGDQILLVGGRPVDTLGRALNLVSEFRSAASITVRVRRGTEIIDFRFDFD